MINPLRLWYVAVAILLLILPSACSQSDGKDDPNAPDFEEGIPTEVRITLSARPNNASTRGDGEEKDPTSSVELIHNWWIVFINHNTKEVVKIIKDTDTAPNVYDKVPSTSVIVDGGGYEAETFRTVLPSGKYRIYAFANIDANTNLDKFEKSDNFKNGQLKDIYINHFVTNAFREIADSPNKDMQWFDKIKDDKGNTVDNYIPMAQIMPEVNISNTVEDAINIEVVRTVAKVEFTFSNPTEDIITLKNLDFSPISKGEKISIVPANEALGIGPNYKILQDINTDTATLKFDSFKVSTLNAKTSDYMSALEFYCKESLARLKEGENRSNIINTDKKLYKDQLEKFTIRLSIERNGKTETKEFQPPTINYINRNDWINFRIKFNNWVIKWKLHTYPPIGGYPAVFSQSGDGETLTATMTTGGEFELYPELITQNGEKYTVDWSKADQMKVEVESDENKLFITKPEIIDNPNVTGHPLNSTDFPKIIVGELDPKKVGEAKVKITFYLKDSKNVALDEVKSCTFKIIRQNEAPQ